MMNKYTLRTLTGFAGIACLFLITTACGERQAAEASGTPAADEAERTYLARDGETEYRIVHAEGAPETVVLAAEQLAHYLRASTGADFPVEAGNPADWSTEDPLIVLGMNAFVRDRVGPDLEAESREAFWLATRGRAFLIASHDGEGDPLDRRYRTAAGTLIGTFHFLREHVGVEWYLPGERWEVVPERETLPLPDIAKKRVEPAFRMRGLRFSDAWHMPGKNGVRERNERAFLLWARAHGAGVDALGQPNHETAKIMRPWTKPSGAFTGPKEWLAQVDGERREPRPFRGNLTKTWHGVKPATTHPEVRRIHIEYAREYADKHPETDILPLGLSDGHGYDESAKARALDVPGTDQITDRIMRFYTAVAEAVGETHPDRYIGAYAYQQYREPPRRLEYLPDNLFLMYVQNNTTFRSTEENARTFEEMREWSDLTSNLAFFNYPLGIGFFALPNNNTPFVEELFDVLREADFWGLRDFDFGSIWSMQPDAYLVASLMRNPDADADELKKTFFDDLYGAAAPHIRAYYQRIGESYRHYAKKVALVADDEDLALGVADRVEGVFGTIRDELESLLDKATAAAAEDPAVAERVKVVTTNWQLVTMLLEAAKLGRVADGIADGTDAAQRERARNELAELRRRFHAFIREHGNTDVMTVDQVARMRALRDSYAKWLDISMELNETYRKPYAERKNPRTGRYEPPEQALAAERVKTLPMEWRFRMDPKNEGRDMEAEGGHWAGRRQADHPDWKPIRVDAPWNRQGFDYHGAAWYRVRFDVPESVDADAAKWLLFNAVDGDAIVWLNGRIVGNRQDVPLHQVWDQPWAVETGGHLHPGESNRLVVQVVKESRDAGIWKPVELRVAEPD